MPRKLPLYEKGVYKNEYGHLRYSSPVSLRGKYVHRVKVERLIEETPYSIRIMIPWPYEVHHADYNKENNDPSNFIILSESMHSYMTSHNKRKRFQAKWVKVPDWVLFDDGIESLEEVPF